VTTPFVESPRFPDWAAYWARGGRTFNTTVTRTYGGNEYRNAAWAIGLGEYVWDNADAAAFSQNPSLSAFAYKQVRDLFSTALGQVYAFRFKDFRDYKDDGNGIFVMIDSTHFQMYKHYAVSPLSYNQIIQKPVSATVVVTGGMTPVVDYTTGIVTVASGTPSAWTGEFDIPVRFASDVPQVGPDTTGAQLNWESLKLVEVRNLT
jgi:uncharacterized protein (TIGR02217 family)